MNQQVTVSIKVNGTPVSATVEARTLLVQLLRDHLGLTGTKIGCDTSTCGACTVLVDGRSAKSCTLLAAQAGEAEVTTIEGLATEDGERLSALQAAFHIHHALQCGYCTPGMIMAARSLLDELGDAPTDEAVRAGLKGNVCRCTGYQNIIDAIQAAAATSSRPTAGPEGTPPGSAVPPGGGGGPEAGPGDAPTGPAAPRPVPGSGDAAAPLGGGEGR